MAVTSCAVLSAPRPASAGGVATARAQAAELQARLQTIQDELSAASQAYDADVAQARQLSSRIETTRATIAKFHHAVLLDGANLQKDAVNAYVTSGGVSSADPLFTQNANEAGATAVYNQIAEGNLSGSVATYTNAQQTLAVEQNVLHQAEDARLSASRHEGALLRSDAALSGEINSALAAANANVQAQLRALRQENLARAQAQLRPQGIGTIPNQNFPAPPPNSQANIAVRTALSFLGTPYCWGGASRSCVDCSGLTMLSWQAAGVDLPHYSGAQMADSTPVPVSDLMPGDLLFYGPGGDEHVAMYVGHGTMIEAPYTGAWVWLTPVRLGDGFAGAGRP
ncbi:MAG TPA: NlpC/P60 family protein [Acidimicrobiales bacterium]|nr:NlpC/P60 family protein [Acidimicrobiales bacterium]